MLKAKTKSNVVYIEITSLDVPSRGLPQAKIHTENWGYLLRAWFFEDMKKERAQIFVEVAEADTTWNDSRDGRGELPKDFL